MPHLADIVPALALLVLLVTAYYTGSLANLLWRQTQVRHGRRPTLHEFHRSLVVTPLSLLGAVTTLAMVSH